MNDKILVDRKFYLLLLIGAVLNVLDLIVRIITWLI